MALHVVEGWPSDLMDKLRAADLDLVLGYDLVGSEGIEATDLLEEALVFVASPERIGTAGVPITLAEAVTHELIFYGGRSVSSIATEEAAARRA